MLSVSIERHQAKINQGSRTDDGSISANMKYTRQLNQRVKPHHNYECKKNPLMQEEMARGEKDHINMIMVVGRELNWSSNKQRQAISDTR